MWQGKLCSETSVEPCARGYTCRLAEGLKKRDYYIIEEGTCELLVGSQQPLTKELAKWMGIKWIYHTECF